MTQHITIEGYLGSDPEMHYTQDGLAVTNFSVACNNFRDKDASPTWYRVAAWGRMGESANQFLAKGKRVLVIGTLDIRGYTDKEGFQGWSNDINANVVTYLSLADDSERTADAPKRRSAADENGAEESASKPAAEAAPKAPARRRTK